jgi:protease-4
METVNMKGLGDKLGIQAVSITSGANKDMLNPLKEVNPYHVQMLQDVVNDMYNRFANIVQESRGISSRVLLDGRILTANQALRGHFIDGIGYWINAIDQLQELLEVDDIHLIRYQKKRSFFETLLEAHTPAIPSLKASTAPRFLYQWKP